MDHRILILDGNQRAALASVRSLGSKGLWVAVGETSTPSLAGVSRFCSKQLRYADPFTSPREFFENVLLQIRELGITFLLPVTEATTYVILRYRSELPDSVVLPFPVSEAVEKVANKNALFGLARSQNIPIPETVACNSVDDGLSVLETIDNFPVVLKPFKSRILRDDAIISSQVIVAHSKEEAQAALQSHSFFRFPFTIQSFVEGFGQGVFALFDHGQPRCYFAHRRLREKPPGGGVSVLSESSQVNETLKASAEKLLHTVGWHGVAMVEFRVAQDGTGYLMEINPRFWGSLQLAIDSGVDFPWLLYLVSVGERLPEVKSHYGQLRWLLGDLDRLYLVMKAPGTVYSAAAKILEILRFLKPGLRTRHEVNRLNDLRPFWFELKHYLLALRK
ncbi:ATP-grasp domain-containing protein [Marinobacter sp. M-5]|uniref:carboxylate--amine ligase n=1 Tax=Marinobacter sp. M-5 TaxID=3081089 RepID=UPI00293C322C|nr:ATP-grasp domain-containing protein [Marinobacter sp. M-5]MDV3503498.1 ATP-grasp domain-containing protein [Marinobacter sp. M-5]